jgi:tetratricopeptide (TPR) repeat protein
MTLWHGRSRVIARLCAEFDLLNLTHSAASLDCFTQKHREAGAVHGAGSDSGELRLLEWQRDALRLSPFNPVAFVAHIALGDVAVVEGRYDEAASQYAKAVQANPRFSVAYFCQAIALALAGRVEEAGPIVRQLWNSVHASAAAKFSTTQ